MHPSRVMLAQNLAHLSTHGPAPSRSTRWTGLRPSPKAKAGRWQLERERVPQVDE